jgi:hypothetical protein
MLGRWYLMKGVHWQLEEAIALLEFCWSTCRFSVEEEGRSVRRLWDSER